MITLGINGSWYMISDDFVQSHPGGSDVLTSCDGFDVSDLFQSYHLKKIDILRRWLTFYKF